MLWLWDAATGGHKMHCWLSLRLFICTFMFFSQFYLKNRVLESWNWFLLLLWGYAIGPDNEDREPTSPKITVTITEALVLRPLLEDRGHITESIRILVPVDGMKQKYFQITTKQVRWSQQFQLRSFSKWIWYLLLHHVLVLW